MLTSINFLLATYTNTINKIEISRREDEWKKNNFPHKSDENFSPFLNNPHSWKYGALVHRMIQEKIKSDAMRSFNNHRSVSEWERKKIFCQNKKMKINKDLKRHNKLFYLSIRNSTRGHKTKQSTKICTNDWFVRLLTCDKERELLANGKIANLLWEWIRRKKLTNDCDDSYLYAFSIYLFAVNRRERILLYKHGRSTTLMLNNCICAMCMKEIVVKRSLTWP